jgi:hypothetical protein
MTPGSTVSVPWFPLPVPDTFGNFCGTPGCTDEPKFCLMETLLDNGARLTFKCEACLPDAIREVGSVKVAVHTAKRTP